MREWGAFQLSSDCWRGGLPLADWWSSASCEFARVNWSSSRLFLFFVLLGRLAWKSATKFWSHMALVGFALFLLVFLAPNSLLGDYLESNTRVAAAYAICCPAASIRNRQLTYLLLSIEWLEESYEAMTTSFLFSFPIKIAPLPFSTDNSLKTLLVRINKRWIKQNDEEKTQLCISMDAIMIFFSICLFLSLLLWDSFPCSAPYFLVIISNDSSFVNLFSRKINNQTFIQKQIFQI